MLSSRRAQRAAGLGVGLCVAGALTIGLSGTALAASPLAPTSGCYFDNGDNTITAVFGYANTGAATSIPVGPNNQVYIGTSVTQYSSPTQNQPTSFVTGSPRSVFTVTAPSNGGAAWYLNGKFAFVATIDDPGDGISKSPICGQDTSLPVSNGAIAVLLGLAVILPVGGRALSRRRTVLGGGQAA